MKNINFIDRTLFGIENLIRGLSKGYFLDFSEYHADGNKAESYADSTFDSETDLTSNQEQQQKED